MLLVFTLFSAVGLLLAANNGQYTTKYDDIDIDAVIRSERLTNNYVGCLLETRPCTPDAAELKSKCEENKREGRSESSIAILWKKLKKRKSSYKQILGNLPDALATDCSGCSAKQKEAADKISHHLIDDKPEDWKLLEAKYDPTGAYRARYLDGRSENAVDKEEE